VREAYPAKEGGWGQERRRFGSEEGLEGEGTPSGTPTRGAAEARERAGGVAGHDPE